jgi:hypothetical protein
MLGRTFIVSVGSTGVPACETGERRQGRLRHQREVQLLGFLGVPLLEAFNAARRVDVLLRAREERMTLRADADTHVFVRGPSLDDAAARTVDDRIDIFWMNLCFHDQGLET